MERLAKWGRIFRARTMQELEMLAKESEVFQTMVTYLKKLTNNDEKVRMQMESREDYERRMSGQYRTGKEEGFSIGQEQGIRIGQEQGIRIGQERGRLQQLFDLVSSGVLSFNLAIENSGLDTATFESEYRKYKSNL